MATTGAAWDLENPKKPVVEHDPQDELDYPLDWTDFLSETSTTLVTVVASFPATTPTNPMKLIAGNIFAAGLKFMARIGVDSGIYVSATHDNKKFPVTFTATDSSGQIKQRTLWFKLVQE